MANGLGIFRKVPKQAWILGSALAVLGLVSLGVSMADTTPDRQVGTDVRSDGRIIVKLKEDVARSAADSLYQRLGATVIKNAVELRIDVIQVTTDRRDAVIAEITSSGLAETAEPDAAAALPSVQDNAVARSAAETSPASFVVTGGVNDEYYRLQRAWRTIGADIMWKNARGSSDVTIGVMGTGVRPHPELADKLVPGYGPSEDMFGYSTEDALIIAAKTNNTVGVASSCGDCKIAPIHTLAEDNRFYVSDIVLGLEWARSKQLTAVYISEMANFEGACPASLQASLDQLYAGNIPVIVPARTVGDVATAALNAPSNCQKVISVTTTGYVGGPQGENEETLTAFSVRNKAVTIASASYLQAYATYNPLEPTREYYTDGGMYGSATAAAIVTSVVGALRGAFPAKSVAEITQAMTATATPCCENSLGSGRLNAIKAYQYLKNGSVTDNEPPVLGSPQPADGIRVLKGVTNLSVSPTDNVGIARVDFYIDNRLEKGAELSVAPFVYEMDSNKLGFLERDVPIKAIAYDTSGNASVPKEWTIRISTYKTGDITRDGLININDLSRLLSRWGKVDTLADINGDQAVNILDLSILLSQWGK